MGVWNAGIKIIGEVQFQKNLCSFSWVHFIVGQTAAVICVFRCNYVLSPLHESLACEPGGAAGVCFCCVWNNSSVHRSCLTFAIICQRTALLTWHFLFVWALSPWHAARLQRAEITVCSSGAWWGAEPTAWNRRTVMFSSALLSAYQGCGGFLPGFLLSPS